MLVPKPKFGKFLKNNRKSGLMNWNVQTLVPKWKLPRWKSNWKPLMHQTFNVSTSLRHRCCSNDKLNILFQPCHVRRWNSHYISELVFNWYLTFWRPDWAQCKKQTSVNADIVKKQMCDGITGVEKYPSAIENIIFHRNLI